MEVSFRGGVGAGGEGGKRPPDGVLSLRPVDHEGFAKGEHEVEFFCRESWRTWEN